MVLILVASVFFVAVYGQASDPTKACLPDVLQVQTASLVNNIHGVVAFDFPSKKVANRLGNGIRSIVNVETNVLTIINETSGACSWSSPIPEGVKQLASQCLPASAKLVTSTSTFFGLSPNSVELEGWEYTVANFGTVRLAVTKGTPGVLVLGQIVSPNPVLSDVRIFVNPQTSIDDLSIFDSPENCERSTVFG